MSFCRMMSRLCGTKLHDAIVEALGINFYGCSVLVVSLDDSVTGNALASANVTLFRNRNGVNTTIESQLTDSNGIAVFYGLKNKPDYRLRITKPGYDSLLDLTSFATNRCSYVVETRDLTPAG